MTVAVSKSYWWYVLARNIRKVRKARGLSQADVAKRLSVSRVAVTNWERVKAGNQPSLDHLRSLARIFGVSVDDLLAGRAS